MQNISFYIAYLLTTQECVIIPGLGAFIAFESEERQAVARGLLCPPAKLLGLNPDIRHNDGLLAHLLAKGENISYKEACLQIQHYVDQLTENLESQTVVTIPWVGKLTLSGERKIVFTPFFRLSCNADYFGLNNLYMPDLEELDRNEKCDMEDFETPEKKSMGWRIVAIVAIIVALCAISIPLTDQWKHSSQLANVISVPDLTPSQAAPDIIPATQVEKAEKETSATPEEKPAPIQQESSNFENASHYYIVVASFATKAVALIQLQDLLKDDFSAAGIVSDGKRCRVYVEKFIKKRDAEAYLAKLKFRYFEHQDAWILKQ